VVATLVAGRAVGALAAASPLTAGTAGAGAASPPLTLEVGFGSTGLVMAWRLESSWAARNRDLHESLLEGTCTVNALVASKQSQLN
jgi:hypothetical protein